MKRRSISSKYSRLPSRNWLVRTNHKSWLMFTIPGFALLLIAPASLMRTFGSTWSGASTVQNVVLDPQGPLVIVWSQSTAASTRSRLSKYREYSCAHKFLQRRYA